MRDFSIHLTHRPGELGRVANVLSKRGINIKSLAAMTVNGHAILRLIPDDIESARAALDESHIRYDETELATVLLENRAGEIAGAADKLAAAGLNVEAIYVVGLEGDLVELAIACNDAKRARKAFESAS